MTRIEIVRLPHAADLPLPSYATEGSAGLDLIAAVGAEVELKPGARVCVPCGIAIALPVGFEAQMRPRSGLAIKHGIILPNSPARLTPITAARCA